MPGVDSSAIWISGSSGGLGLRFLSHLSPFLRIIQVDILCVARNVAGRRCGRPGCAQSPSRSTLTPDGIFEPGEVWQFIIDDYANALGSPPSAMASLGFAGASSVAFDPTLLSSGSIVQMVPAPGGLALLGLGCVSATGRRRS